MKSKGMTMVELIVSVGLISIVMVFVFNILVDMRQEETNGSFKSQDLINRSLIIRTIQKDFINKKLYTINECLLEQEDDIVCLNFVFRDNSTATLKIAKNTVEYNGEKWTLQTGSYDIKNEDYKYCYNYVEKGKFYYVTLMFYVNLRGHVLESNVLLDLELFNTGLVSDVCLPGTSRTDCGNILKLNNTTNLCDSYRSQDEETTNN